MKCLDCGVEMEQGTVEAFGQGGIIEEFTSDEENSKTGLKAFLPEKQLVWKPLFLKVRMALP